MAAPSYSMCQRCDNMTDASMVLHTFIAWRTAKLQAASCQTDFCLVELAAEAQCSMSGKTYYVRVTTMEELDQGFLHSFNKAYPRQTAGNRTPNKELSKSFSFKF
jgi:hypothetical protein